jgi:HEAT repeat protein
MADAPVPFEEKTMPSIREELCRFIRLNEQEQWVGAYDGLEELERFGDDLIPGLIECLSDGHPDVRHQAVTMLGAARPRSDVAVPNLIERLADEDWLIVTSVILALGDFGTLAAAGIPQIEGWLESPNEYLRLLAATTIMKLDPSRTEFLPMIRQSTNSDHPVVRSSALEFFGEDEDTDM